MSQVPLFAKVPLKSNGTLFIVVATCLIVCYLLQSTCSAETIPAFDKITYMVNKTNSNEDPTTHAYLSPRYQYDQIFGVPYGKMNFDNAVVYFEHESNAADYSFTIDVLSGEIDNIAKTTFGTLQVSVQSTAGTPSKAIFRFNAPEGILNTDLLRHTRAYFIDPSSYNYELTPVGDRYGVIRRYYNMFEVELNMKTIMEVLGKNSFQLSIWTDDSPNDPEPLVDFRWIEVLYPSTYMMKLESLPSVTRYFGVMFMGQPPINYLQNLPPRFMLSEVNNIQMKDIKDPKVNDGTYTIMKSYSLQVDRNLDTTNSYVQYNYNYNDLKDIYGNDVEIKFDEVYCGSSRGVAYQSGVPIYPFEATYEKYGTIMCPASVMVPNSVIIIYAKIVMIKRPQVDMLTNTEKVSGEVSNGFGKLLRSGEIEKDTCIKFTGSVLKSKLSIYMLQQKLETYNIIPSPKLFTQVQTLEKGSDSSAKFCSTKDSFEKVGAFNQEMAFLLISEENSNVSEFQLVTQIGEPSVAGTVIGILFALGFVTLVVVASIVGGVLYWRKRKAAAYNAIK